MKRQPCPKGPSGKENTISIKQMCEILNMSESGVKKVIKKLKRVGSLRSSH